MECNRKFVQEFVDVMMLLLMIIDELLKWGGGGYCNCCWSVVKSSYSSEIWILLG